MPTIHWDVRASLAVHGPFRHRNWRTIHSWLVLQRDLLELCIQPEIVETVIIAGCSPRFSAPRL